MADDHADAGVEESDSEHDSADADAKLTTAQALRTAGEERRRAALDEVSFRECRWIRTAGERYRVHRSLPRLRAEFADHWETLAKVREAVQTYYLVHEAPTLAGPDRVFENGYRFFEGARLTDLDGGTETEAKEAVQRFVGQTLLDNDVASMDLDEPVSEMGLPLSVATEKSEAGESISVSSVPELMAAKEVAREVVTVQSMLDTVRASVTPEVARELGSTARAAFRAAELYAEAMPSSRTLTAGVAAGIGSSLVASQGISGLQPSAFQVLGQPAVRSMMEAMTVFSEVYEPPLASMLSGLSQDFFQQIQWQANELARTPALQMSELFNEQFFQQITQIARQFDRMQTGAGGVAAMGAVATTLGTQQDVSSQPSPSSPVQSLPEPTSSAPVADVEFQSEAAHPTWQDRQRVSLPSPQEMPLLYVGFADVIITLIILMYPEQRELLFASPIFKLLLAGYVLRQYPSPFEN